MVDIETVEKITNLARLELSDADKQAMADEMGKILEYVEQLQKVDTAGVEPTAYMESERDVLRDDVPHKSLSPEELLKNGPKVSKGHFAVPKVIG